MVFFLMIQCIPIKNYWAINHRILAVNSRAHRTQVSIILHMIIWTHSFVSLLDLHSMKRTRVSKVRHTFDTSTLKNLFNVQLYIHCLYVEEVTIFALQRARTNVLGRNSWKYLDDVRATFGDVFERYVHTYLVYTQDAIQLIHRTRTWRLYYADIS